MAEMSGKTSPHVLPLLENQAISPVLAETEATAIVEKQWAGHATVPGAGPVFPLAQTTTGGRRSIIGHSGEKQFGLLPRLMFITWHFLATAISNASTIQLRRPTPSSFNALIDISVTLGEPDKTIDETEVPCPWRL